MLRKSLIYVCLLLCACSEPEEVKKETEKPDKTDALTKVPDSRVQTLSKGLNLAHWFAQADNVSSSNLKNRFTATDFDFIKAAGFTYVRLSVDENIVFNSADPAIISTTYLAELDNAILAFTTREVGVLFDFHPTQTFKDKVASNADFARQVKLFWGSMAKYLSTYDPELVFLEVMNEPATVNASQWYEIQKEWVPVIRNGAPTHTIVVDGNLRLSENNWDDVAAFTAQAPVADGNVVYNLHLYAPMAFTHQGATWAWSALPDISGLQYPTNATNANAIKNATSNQETIWAMENYIKDNWNAQKLEAWVKPIDDWSKKYNRPVTVNEFGVYNYVAPEASRIAYMKDIRVAFEKYKIGWAVWEYDKGFMVAEKKNGQVNFLPGMKDALGL